MSLLPSSDTESDFEVDFVAFDQPYQLFATDSSEPSCEANELLKAVEVLENIQVAAILKVSPSIAFITIVDGLNQDTSIHSLISAASQVLIQFLDNIGKRTFQEHAQTQFALLCMSLLCRLS